METTVFFIVDRTIDSTNQSYSSVIQHTIFSAVTLACNPLVYQHHKPITIHPSSDFNSFVCLFCRERERESDDEIGKHSSRTTKARRESLFQEEQIQRRNWCLHRGILVLFILLRWYILFCGPLGVFCF